LGPKQHTFSSASDDTYTSHDGDAKKAIDVRLNEIAKLFPAFAVNQGWSITETGIFILSFYGDGGQISSRKSNSKYTVYYRRSVGTLFPPCALKFTNDFIEYSERIVGQWCAEQIDPDLSSVDQVGGAKKIAQHEEGQDENPTTFDVETNLFEILDRWQFVKTDRFEVGSRAFASSAMWRSRKSRYIIVLLNTSREICFGENEFMVLCWNRPACYAGRWSRRMVEHDSRTKPTADALSRSRAPTGRPPTGPGSRPCKRSSFPAFTERGRGKMRGAVLVSREIALPPRSDHGSRATKEEIYRLANL
jgi:hypothetical protein